MKETLLDEMLLALGRRIAALKPGARPEIVEGERLTLLALYGEMAKVYRGRRPRLAREMEAVVRGNHEGKIVLKGRIRLIKRTSKKRILAHSVAQQVKLARSRKGWRQEDLARLTGIARPNIARLEAGRFLPKLATLSIVADALGIELKTLISMPEPLSGADALLAEQGLADWDRALKRIDRGR